ncbi:MAG TPA: SRPBCC domain-containing protein [Steroidobacteraceae bacterium]|jgi:uncharacterized protein YndB with AHSA1/START domain|nr:SRPBCC domain-containing protein [Steroidobacteraceae bacterium]
MLTLIVRRTIRATPARLFEAWTQPAQLRQWWGPESVVCIDAEVDLRVGGRYRIANRFADGKILWIAGEFEAIEAPHKLVYTWALEPVSGATERVTVQFRPLGESTEVIVTHEGIASVPVRQRHEQGWQGCLSGLADYLQLGARVT